MNWVVESGFKMVIYYSVQVMNLIAAIALHVFIEAGYAMVTQIVLMESTSRQRNVKVLFAKRVNFSVSTAHAYLVIYIPFI